MALSRTSSANEDTSEALELIPKAVSVDLFEGTPQQFASIIQNARRSRRAINKPLQHIYALRADGKQFDDKLLPKLTHLANVLDSMNDEGQIIRVLSVLFHEARKKLHAIRINPEFPQEVKERLRKDMHILATTVTNQLEHELNVNFTKGKDFLWYMLRDGLIRVSDSHPRLLIDKSLEQDRTRPPAPESPYGLQTVDALHVLLGEKAAAYVDYNFAAARVIAKTHGNEDALEEEFETQLLPLVKASKEYLETPDAVFTHVIRVFKKFFQANKQHLPEREPKNLRAFVKKILQDPVFLDYREQVQPLVHAALHHKQSLGEVEANFLMKFSAAARYVEKISEHGIALENNTYPVADVRNQFKAAFLTMEKQHNIQGIKLSLDAFRKHYPQQSLPYENQKTLLTQEMLNAEELFMEDLIFAALRETYAEKPVSKPAPVRLESSHVLEDTAHVM